MRSDDLDVVAELGEPSRDSQLGSDKQSGCLSENNSNNYSGESDNTDSMNGTDTGRYTDSDDDKASEITDSFRGMRGSRGGTRGGCGGTRGGCGGTRGGRGGTRL